ncbi:MAG TPA: twin-arginine translocation signal domain-containing protein, partial [Gemmatimonadaceae bacterium]|nr:twin-arginine translocation signal domain-containing protein [Gemmatimonadaceae bacterium]
MESQSEDAPVNRANEINRRDFVQRAAMTAAAFAVNQPLSFLPGSSKDDVLAQIPKQHDQTVKMLRDWIALPSIAAENRGYPQGAEYMANLAREAGFQRVELVPSAGKPGVFGTLDAGAKTTLGIYFMYDVKQYDPAEWSSPPLEGRIVDKPGVGKAIVG